MHSGRVCAVCTVTKYRALNPAGRRLAIAPETVAEQIRRDHGELWPSIVAFAISYSQALKIRNGWRGGGRQVEPIPYRSRGWESGAQTGREAGDKRSYAGLLDRET